LHVICMGDMHILQGTLNKHLGLLEHVSFDFMEDAQILTCLNSISTLQCPPHTNRDMVLAHH